MSVAAHNLDFRMALYLACMIGEKDVVTSVELGEFADVQPSVARRDLLQLGNVGVRGQGYVVADVVPLLYRWVYDRRQELGVRSRRAQSALYLVQWLLIGMVDGGVLDTVGGAEALLARFRAGDTPTLEEATA